MRQIELLAPAKNLEQGITAIKCGADAVYIAGPCFGARKAASNSFADIEKLISYANQFQVKVYIALNTILFENELKTAQEHIYTYYNMGASAIIFQDFALLQMQLPPISLHASTQTNNYSIERITWLSQIGVDRIILARELSIQQISEITNNVNTELECFIHGALCVCYSGQCYLSLYHTGRSANRGECSQPCRLNYTVSDIKGNTISSNAHILSLKDFKADEYIEQLIDIGITSFKIEGRLKDEKYVKNTVLYYRKLIDSIISKKEGLGKSSIGTIQTKFEPDIHKSFNRDYTSYFLSGNRTNMANLQSPKWIGEYIGIIQKVEKTGLFVSLQPNVTISNGDGLTYFDENNVLQGIRVNTSNNGFLTIQGNTILKKGIKLYRNFSQDFDNYCNKESVERKIPIHIYFYPSEGIIHCKVEDVYGHTFHHITSLQWNNAENQEAVKTKNYEVLSKLGDTCFILNQVQYQNSTVCFIPAKILTTIKKEICEKLMKCIISNQVKIISKEKKYIPYSLPLTHSDNLTNPLSQKYFSGKQQPIVGVDALPVIPFDTPLMHTKYCIRFEIRLCPTQNKTISNADDLLIKSGNLKLRVTFDCKKCEMKLFQVKISNN
ncbi:MAG: U32 family peptidase [Bacteroidales bacterium]